MPSYKYYASEYSKDVRCFEVVSNVELTAGDIHNALALPDITTIGDVVIDGGLKVIFTGTDYGDDSQVEYYLEKPKLKLKLIKGGKDAKL
jgi:hypothetical protein